MKRYKHFLLTRFNVPFIRKENIDFLFEKQYLDNRFDIFKKCCFSSIKQQTNQDFIWLVFFDSRTPDAYKEINKSLNQEYNNYCPVYIDIENLPNENNFYDNEALKATSKKNIDDLTYCEKIQKISLAAEFSRIINSFCGEEDDWIVTTRIDNDDAFHKYMMKDVIKNIPDSIDEDKLLLSFDNGVQYVDNTYILRTFHYPNNHFTSLVEKRTPHLFTVLYWDHFFVEKYIKVKHISANPLWMEICHKANVINSISLTPENNFVWGKVSLNNYGIRKKWNGLATILCLMTHPYIYIIPKIKYLIKKVL